MKALTVKVLLTTILYVGDSTSLGEQASLEKVFILPSQHSAVFSLVFLIASYRSDRILSADGLQDIKRSDHVPDLHGGNRLPAIGSLSYFTARLLEDPI
jgi:hypothetical protein